MNASKDPVVLLMLRNYERAERPSRLRQRPITRHRLGKLLRALEHGELNDWDTKLFQAIFTLMYFGAMRVGEVAVSRHDKHTLGRSDVLVLN